MRQIDLQHNIIKHEGVDVEITCSFPINIKISDKTGKVVANYQITSRLYDMADSYLVLEQVQ